MISAVEARPYTYRPAWAPIVWQVVSSKSTMIDFKFVFDIYINGVFSSRIKQKANPAGYGVIDVESFCQANLDMGKALVEHTDCTTIFRTGDYITNRIYLLIGEEYRTAVGGELRIYNGNTNAVGDPSYYVGAAADGALITAVGTTAGSGKEVVFGGGFKDSWNTYYTQWAQFINTDYDYCPRYGHTGMFLSDLPTGTASWQRDAWLTDSDQFSLTFRNRTYSGVTGQAFVYGAKLDWYSATGTTAFGSAYLYNVVGSGGGPLSTIAGVMPTTAAYQYDVVQLAVGPIDIMSRLEETWPGASVNYYTIQLYGRTGTTGGYGNPISEKIRVNVVDDDDWGFGRWRFSWLNSQGGRDWFSFVKQNVQTDSINKDTYYKIPPFWSTGIYGSSNLDPAKYGDTTAQMSVTKSFTAMSDWVTESQATFLESLFNSPHVLGWAPDNTGPYLVNVESKSFEVKKYAKENMFNYTIDFNIGQPTITQRA